ncbi:unnamed protein product [Ectocarpus fasciculatus]
MARGEEEARPEARGAGAAPSELAAASTGTTIASTDVPATTHHGEGVGDAAATAGRLGAGEGEGEAKDSSDDDSDGRDNNRARGARDGTVEPVQDGQLGSAASPASSTRDRDERDGGGPNDSGDNVDDDRPGGGNLATPAAAGSSVRQHASSPTIEFCSLRSAAAAKIQSLVRMSQAYKEYERKWNEAWNASRGARRARRRARNALKNANHPMAAMAQGGVEVGDVAADQVVVGNAAVDQAVAGNAAVDQAVAGDAAAAAGSGSTANQAAPGDNAATVRQGAAVEDVAAEPGQEGKLGDAPPRVGGTSRPRKAPVARRNTGTVVAKARTPKSPLPASRAEDRRGEAHALAGVEAGGEPAGSGGAASRRGGQAQERWQVRLHCDHWKERRRELPIRNHREGTQGLAPLVGPGPSSKQCKRGADKDPNEDDPELSARNALAEAVGKQRPSTEAEHRQVIRIGVRAVASAGKGTGVPTSADSNGAKRTSGYYASSEEKVRRERYQALCVQAGPRCPAPSTVAAGTQLPSVRRPRA